MQLSDSRLKLRLGWSVIILLVAAAVLLAAMYQTEWPALPNCCGITYQYVRQWQNGNGLVLNAGERVLLVPAPAYLLMAIAAVTLTAIPAFAIGSIVMALSLIISALLVFRLLRKSVDQYWLAVIGTGVYCAAWLALWRGGTITQPTASMFCLLALVLAFADRWLLAGLMVAVATLCSPEAGILGVPLLLLAANKGTGGRFFMAVVVPLIVAVIGLYLYYGSGLWNGLLGYKGVDLDFFFDPGQLVLLILPIAALVAWAFSGTRATPILAVCGVWITLHLLIIGIVLRSESALSFTLLATPSILLLFVAAQHSQFSEMNWLAPVFTAAVVVASYIVIGTPIRESITAPDVPVDATVTWIGNNPVQHFTALDGELQPELKAMLERNDIQSVLIRYMPTSINFVSPGPIRLSDLRRPAVLPLNYQRQGDSNIYALTSNPHPEGGDFQNSAVSASFGPDIKLTGLGIDRTSLAPGQYARLRLDWQVARPADQNISVDLELYAGKGDHFLVAHASDNYDPTVFRAGTYSTYHTLSVSNSAAPGPVTLQVSMTIAQGVAARVPIATLSITTP